MDSALVNMYKAQKSPAVQHVGVTAFYLVVAYVCEDTLRHPPTRQYLSSCVEILGQVHTCKMHIVAPHCKLSANTHLLNISLSYFLPRCSYKATQMNVAVF